MIAPGLIIAAPASDCGKTLVTLGLLRHFRRTGLRCASVKAGPDYIDPAFHVAASAVPCFNLDIWAMRRQTLLGAAAMAAADAQLLLCEGVMGLFDGATEDQGSTADLAALLGWPVVLVIDAAAQAASAAAVLRGFAGHRSDVQVTGVIYNRVGSAAHADVLRRASFATLPEITIIGCLPRHKELSLPSRHLGLVQALEHPDLQAFLDGAADLMSQHLDTEALVSLAQRAKPDSPKAQPLAPLGQKIAIAKDAAFAFSYPLTLRGWREAGAEIAYFSPLDDQAPAADADAIYLPGGYPELWAGRLAGNEVFMGGLREAAERGVRLFGECGGYMVLGRGLTDKNGDRHAMAGLLGLETSFAHPKLHLGYRRATQRTSFFPHRQLTGHEFHYGTVEEETGSPFLDCADARGRELGPAGLIDGSVAGSFIHLIDRA